MYIEKAGGTWIPAFAGMTSGNSSFLKQKGGGNMKQSLILKHIGAFAMVLTILAVPMVAFGQWSVGNNNAQSAGTPDASIYEIIKTTMNYLLAILGFIAIIGFVISGILYLTAAGDEKRMGSAKNAMFYSIMGVIVALVGYVIVSAVDSWLRAGSNTQI